MDHFSNSQVVRKPAVRSSGGLVAAQHRRAAETGARVLAQGGNAVDAAIATSFAIGVLEPWMSGLGGGGAMVVRMGGSGTTFAVDFDMRAPGALDPEDYPLVGGVSGDLFPWARVAEDRNLIGPTSIAVPGLVDGMRVAWETFATLDWRDLVLPAADLADEGLLVDWYASLMITGGARELARYPTSRETFLPDGFPPVSAWTASAETRLPLERLTRTLRRLADEGPRSFYEGALAQSIVEDVSTAGGCLSATDLAGYQATVADPLVVDHGGGHLFLTPEMTAGPTMADALARFASMGGYSETSDGGPDAATYVNFARALDGAYRRRFEVMGDVDGGRGPTCTTHFNVVDRNGNMVAVTQTLLSLFGSKFTAPATGVVMNNGIQWFDPEPGRPNSLGPGKRCLANVCPLIARSGDGDRYFALGASGGRKILPAVFQLSAFLTDGAMTLEQAFHQPRIDVSGGAVIADRSLGDSVLQALSEEFDTLGARRTVYPYSFACPSGIYRDSGVNQGATEIMSPWGDAVTEEVFREPQSSSSTAANSRSTSIGLPT